MTIIFKLHFMINIVLWLMLLYFERVVLIYFLQSDR